MKIQGETYRTIWLHPEQPGVVQIIDQRWLPHQLVIEDLKKVEDFEAAIREMHVRGAPLIGATAAMGLYVACLEAPLDKMNEYLSESAQRLKATRPTAVDLFYAVDRVERRIQEVGKKEEKAALALEEAMAIIEESVSFCRSIGEHGLHLIEAISKLKKGEPVNVLTHCNAGWIACIDYGTATAPVYMAHDKGIPVHVWVDETRPRNQGARITAFELGEHGVPHTVIPDNTGGHLMQHGMVDLVIVGTDRTTRQGDVANKIGTYLKALAAHANDVPFYVALPSSSLDMSIGDGLKEIPIEQRNPDEVRYIQGLHEGEVKRVLLTPEASPAVNYGFDVTPAHLVTGLITERGVCGANEQEIAKLFPERVMVKAK
jgi:methylthioribose-1-phosphate isomerase